MFVTLCLHCRQLAVPYVAATGTATATALVLNNVVAKVSSLMYICVVPVLLLSLSPPPPPPPSVSVKAV